MKNPLRNLRVKIVIVACLWIIPVTGLIWHCYTIQVKRHKELLTKARNRYTTNTAQDGKYGEIFDADGRVLVGNEPKVTIECSPYSAVYEPYNPMVNRKKSNLPKAQALRKKRREILADFIAAHTGLSRKECWEKLAPFVPIKDKNGKDVLNPDGTIQTRPNKYWMVFRDMPPKDAEKFRAELLKLKDLYAPGAGFVFRDIYVRTYPQGKLFANVLGFADVAKDKIVARSGLEKQFAQLMKPEKGEISYERDREGRRLVYGRQSSTAAKDGKHIYLTIREPMQAILESELDKAMAEYDPEKIYAVVLDPNTGDILAMGQRPNFDPNDRGTFKVGTTNLNLSSDTYEPGSVMKPFTIARALDQGVVTADSRIDCENLIWFYGGRSLRDSSRRCAGNRTINEILMFSSNIGTAKVGLLLGDEKLNALFDELGFGRRKTGLFYNESSGSRPVLNSRRDKVTPTRVPIGYAVRVTILQLARAYCAIAGKDGAMPELRLIDRIVDPNTGKETKMPYAKKQRFFRNQQAHDALRQILINVVHDSTGTGKKARVEGYEVAGKTGTSRKFRPELKGYGEGKNIHYYASFAGFVPARNPRLLMVVTVDHPRKVGTGGGAVAAPIFSRTMARMLRHLNVTPDFVK